MGNASTSWPQCATGTGKVAMLAKEKVASQQPMTFHSQCREMVSTIHILANASLSHDLHAMVLSE
jgi:hypothetical protein